MTKPRVLFLCTGNFCQSQMAEGWSRSFRAGALESFSAGIEIHGLNPRAVQVMAECGVDISCHRSKGLGEFAGEAFDCVVTVCGHAHETCPSFRGGTKTIHAPFDDPPLLAESADNEEEVLGHYRRVRDEIREFVEGLPGRLGKG
ncbi:MAG: arsenate reductase ArsC [Nitrospinota bacterium]|nr:arsenate reductase ArsC [Nitrospinota bacterium]